MRISDWSSDVCSSDLASGPGNMPSPMPVRRILATTREIGAAMLLRIPNPESRIPVVQKIPHSVPKSLAAGFEMRLRPPFGPRHVAARAGAVAQPGRGVEHVPHLFGVVLPVGGQVQ